MSDLQDVSQQTASVSNDSATSALDDSQADAGSDQAVVGQDSGADTEAAKAEAPLDGAEWKKRYDGLQSLSNKEKYQFQQALQQRDTYINQLANKLQEVSDRVDQGVNRQPQQAQAEQKIDYNSMSPEELVMAAREEAKKEFDALITQREQSAQEQARKADFEKKQADREAKFQASWGELRAQHPEINIPDLEAYMVEQNVFNPEKAFILKNLDQYIELKRKGASKEAQDKIVKNVKAATASLSGTSRMPSASAPTNARQGTPKKANPFTDVFKGFKEVNNG